MKVKAEIHGEDLPIDLSTVTSVGEVTDRFSQLFGAELDTSHWKCSYYKDQGGEPENDMV